MSNNIFEIVELYCSEYEETMDALQTDIDNLENEKLDLKKKFDTLSKKTLLQDLARQTSGIGALVAGELRTST
jgi:dynactin 1